jgi:hypothetical protein
MHLTQWCLYSAAALLMLLLLLLLLLSGPAGPHWPCAGQGRA